MEILAAVEALPIPAAVDLAAIVIGALTGGLLAAREGFAVSGVLLLAVSGGLGGGLIRDVLLGDRPPVARPASDARQGHGIVAVAVGDDQEASDCANAAIAAGSGRDRPPANDLPGQIPRPGVRPGRIRHTRKSRNRRRAPA